MTKWLDVSGVSVPSLLYGTAWKEDDTERLTWTALQSGFRGIDTANQRKHYFEAGVGAALRRAFGEGVVRREDLFLQTKFTQRSGQDARLPYDASAPFTDQVEQSFRSSLEHLGVTYIDSYVLHGPKHGDRIVDQDWEIWRAMETLHQTEHARLLGVSNVTCAQLEELYAGAEVKPAMVQNRCYASRGWDRDVRAFCASRGMVYQGFSLLTANVDVLGDPFVIALARRHMAVPAEIILRFALHVGMIALTGTRSPEHMRLDLDVLRFSLSSDDVRAIEEIRAP